MNRSLYAALDFSEDCSCCDNCTLDNFSLSKWFEHVKTVALRVSSDNQEKKERKSYRKVDDRIELYRRLVIWREEAFQKVEYSGMLNANIVLFQDEIHALCMLNRETALLYSPNQLAELLTRDKEWAEAYGEQVLRIIRSYDVYLQMTALGLLEKAVLK